MLNFRHHLARLKYELKQLPRLRHERHIRVGILVFLMVLASFGVGYLVGRDWTPAPIVIEKHD